MCSDFTPQPGRFIKRLGYSGFLSLIWMLWCMNRNCKRLDIHTKAEIVFPVRWLR